MVLASNLWNFLDISNLQDLAHFSSTCNINIFRTLACTHPCKHSRFFQTYFPPSSSFLLLPHPPSSSTASSRTQWALLDLNCTSTRAPDLSGDLDCELNRKLGTSAHVKENARIIFQIECQKECENESKNENQIRCQNGCQIECQKRM